MYEVLNKATGELYWAENVAELRAMIEADITPAYEPPSNLSNSRWLQYMIEMGYIIPTMGPDWFMALIPRRTPHDDRPEPTHSVKGNIALIAEDGSVQENGTVWLTHWIERNHVRLVFKNTDHLYAEVFLTEDGLRKLWVKIGKLMGFDEAQLFEALRVLPAARLFTPEILPEKFRWKEEKEGKAEKKVPKEEKEEGSFDIFDAINDLFDGTDSETPPQE